VVRGRTEALAIKIHDYYNSRRPESLRRSWDNLTRIEQVTNISAADHIYIKLAICGLNDENVKQFETTGQFENFLGNERMDNLAKGEHLHWNAVLFANGWNKWNLNDIHPASTVHKDNKRKLHACLVGWEELPSIEDRFGKNYRQYDYDIIRNIFKLIKEEIYS
jgi:hypothetical protein